MKKTFTASRKCCWLAPIAVLLASLTLLPSAAAAQATMPPAKGGDQPNVVPSKAAVWYYFRERTYPKIMEMYADALKMAEGATLMTKTTVAHEVLGSAWPGHMNKAVAEDIYQNIKLVGLPQWSANDQVLARAAR